MRCTKCAGEMPRRPRMTLFDKHRTLVANALARFSPSDDRPSLRYAHEWWRQVATAESCVCVHAERGDHDYATDLLLIAK
jgi:hypothetical protein